MSSVKACLRFFTDALLEFPDPQCYWCRPAVRALAKMPAQERPHVIWATGGPWTSLLVGKRLAQAFNVPFIADFRDPWIGGYELFSSKLLHKKSISLERGVCAAAARVILNTEELRLRFCSVYPEWQHKFVTITNGYAEEVRSFSLPGETWAIQERKGWSPYAQAVSFWYCPWQSETHCVVPCHPETERGGDGGCLPPAAQTVGAWM
jgi:hypothetical protein